MITVGSLFAGIGGLELGLERTGGFKTVWQVENDSYAIRVLEKHWPDVRRWGDVRTFPPRSYEFGYSWRGMPVGPFAPDVKRETTRENWYADLLCGGFPCQDISSAGNRAGIDGKKSGLWAEFARIIGILRPRFVLVENVSALLIRGIDRVLGDLASLGYDAEWESIPAAAVGAPHIRNRVFLLAYPKRDGSGPRGSERSGFLGRASSVSTGSEVANTSRVQQGRQEQRPERQRIGTGSKSKEVADAAKHSRNELREAGSPRQGLSPGRCSSESRTGQWESEPDVGRVANGVPSRVDRLRCLGNAVVPQVAELIGRMILDSS